MKQEHFRLTSGVPGLDDLLGGGLLPGTLTVVVGATGIGKSQLGIHFALGEHAEDRGIIFDMAARGDSQNHNDYARRIGDWNLTTANHQQLVALDGFYQSDREFGEYLHVFDYRGQRVTRRDLEWEQWQAWQAELNARLQSTIGFLYGNFTQGVQRLVVDGIEPADRPNESIQLNLFEYIYHQVLRKDPEWVARDLFRQRYREFAAAAAAATYDPAKIGCLLLVTSQEVMLDELIARRLDEGDALSNANTLIYMGKTHEGTRIGRALYIAKHRGSVCTDEIVPFEIGADGLCLNN